MIFLCCASSIKCFKVYKNRNKKLLLPINSGRGLLKDCRHIKKRMAIHK